MLKPFNYRYLFQILEDNVTNNEAIYKSIYHMGVKMVDDIRKSLRSLAEDLPYLGLIKSMQGMVESVFVKKDCKWKGCEMLIL